MKLLMVNDEVLTVETMKTDIPWERYGVKEVFISYDAESAKDCIREHPIDLMLCDIEMPGENGISLLRWVRENRKEIECIFLTCHANFEYAQEAISLGCQEYILIPAKYEDIGEAVLKVVNRIREQREAARYHEYGKQAIKEKFDQETQAHGQRSVEEIVGEAVCYIINNLGSETLTAIEVAEKTCLHPVYLNRIFKKEKGISVGKYIMNERMALAAELLKKKNLRANAVAEQVGYGSYANFNIMFKKYYGCSPSQYHKQF